MNTSTVIKIQELTKQFGSFTAVDHISFDVRKGEIFGFLGANGAGKTTTLKAIVGIMNFDSGDIYIDGKSI